MRTDTNFQGLKRPVIAKNAEVFLCCGNFVLLCSQTVHIQFMAFTYNKLNGKSADYIDGFQTVLPPLMKDAPLKYVGRLSADETCICK